jgi:homocysteine S-methyltransferase
LTEGGTETEVLYKWSFDLPEFAMFPLLDNPQADTVIRQMYRRYREVAAEKNTGILILGHDYWASPDWGEKLGYSSEGLAEMQYRTIQFLDDIRAEYAEQVTDAYISGCIGPRGDAYGTGGEITESEAEDYHSVQLINTKQMQFPETAGQTFLSPSRTQILRSFVY